MTNVSPPTIRILVLMCTARKKCIWFKQLCISQFYSLSLSREWMHVCIIQNTLITHYYIPILDHRFWIQNIFKVTFSATFMLNREQPFNYGKGVQFTWEKTPPSLHPAAQHTRRSCPSTYKVAHGPPTCKFLTNRNLRLLWKSVCSSAVSDKAGRGLLP